MGFIVTKQLLVVSVSPDRRPSDQSFRTVYEFGLGMEVQLSLAAREDARHRHVVLVTALVARLQLCTTHEPRNAIPAQLEASGHECLMDARHSEKLR